MLRIWNILWETMVYSKVGSNKQHMQSSTYFLSSYLPSDAENSKKDCDALGQGWQTMVQGSNPAATYFFL